MRVAPIGASDHHSRLVLVYQLLHALRQALEQYIETGNLAETQLQEMIDD